jgi:competence protein ComEA
MKKILLALISALAFSVSAWAAVDLNTASQSELESVKGIGPKKAQAIIEFRKKNGNFKTVDELDKVPGFGQKTVDKVKKEITVGNATAAAAGKPEKAVKDAPPANKKAKK